MNTIIRVDRSVKPAYSSWEFKHSEYQFFGPTEYDISKVKLFLHDKQKAGKRIEGYQIYTHLKEKDMLKTCLALCDGEEIQKNGIEIFRQFFNGKALFLWGSVMEGRRGRLHVPYLYDDGNKVLVDWIGLDHMWYDNYYAGCFPG